MFGRTSKDRSRPRWASMAAIGLLTGLLTGIGGELTAQDVLFSLSGTGDHPSGPLEDQEIGVLRSSGAVEPWFKTVSSTFFAGDLDGDGGSEVFNDVDALSRHVDGTVDFSLLQDLGPYRDGDVLRLTTSGGIDVVVPEDRLIQVFGIQDGNCDVDGFAFDPAGVHVLSFAENEDSSVLDSDQPGVISDGAVLWWDEADDSVGVIYSEAEVDALVSAALGTSTSTGDTLSLERGPDGSLWFSVQSPSAHDGSLFSDTNGGSLEVDETAFAFSNTIEIDAFTFAESAPRHPVALGPDVSTQVGIPWTLELSAQPGAELRVLFALGRGDAGSFAPPGFGGLFLSPADPLLWWSLATPWTKATADGNGWASLRLPPVPDGSGPFTLLGQVIDTSAGLLGTPFAVDVE